MEVVNESFEFDVLNYLNSPDDNLSVCEEFDFDLDMMFGSDESSSSQPEDSSKGSTSWDSSNYDLQLTSSEEDFHSFSVFNQKCHKSRRLVLPVRKISNHLNNDILMKSNALVIQMDDQSTDQISRKFSVSGSKCGDLQAMDGLNARLSTLKNNGAQIKEEKDLEEFAHIRGSHLLPKVDRTEENPPSKSKSTQTSVPIHLVRMNWNSFCLMKNLCRDGTENYICRNGNVLLPKVVKSNRGCSRNQMKVFKKRKLQTVVSKVNRSNKMTRKIVQSDDSENIPRTGHDENSVLYSLENGNPGSHIEENCEGDLKSDNFSRLEKVIGNERNYRFSDDNCLENVKRRREKQLKDEIRLRNVSKRTTDYSEHYPPFKVRYLKSLKEKLARINSLPNPTQEVDLPVDDSVSVGEKIVMKEFFASPSSSLKYIQVRNHILRLWRKQRPRHLIKTRIREGLQRPCDVNSLALVFTYLQRIGAINFTKSNEDQGTR